MSNLVASVSPSAALTSLLPNGIRFTYTLIKDTYCRISLRLSLIPNNTYYLSFDVINLPTSGVISFGFYSNGMHNTTLIHNGHNVIQFTAWDESSSLTFDDSGVTIPTGSIFDIVNFNLSDTKTVSQFTKTGIIICLTALELNENICSLYNNGDLVSSNIIEI